MMKDTMTARDVAKELKIDYSTTCKILRQGKIRAYRFPGKWLIPREALDEYYRQYETKPVPAAEVSP